MPKSKVYFTKYITPSSMVKMYDVLNKKLRGKVAVKVHSGETGNQNFLKPELYKDLILKLNGTVVECNTAYEGTRNTNEGHLKTLEDHGWTKYFNVDLMDKDGEMELPVYNGNHLKINYVGKNFANYDSVLVLSHFKGHPMGGYGGALKNISIGIASSHGKALIHGVGNENDIWTSDHHSFLECMADAAKSVVDYTKGNMAFINVMANMSVDCDCCSIAEDPCMNDIGILSSIDPVALDKACIDLVYNSNDPGKNHLIERIESRNGIHTVITAEKLGIGSTDYELISIDNN